MVDGGTNRAGAPTVHCGGNPAREADSLWHDRGRAVWEGEDRGNGIRLDLSLVLLWRHLDGVLALEVGGGCRDVGKSKQKRFAIPKMCALSGFSAILP